MRRFIFLLIILMVSVFIGLKIAEDPGYAIFAYRYWTVEMPLWFAIVSLIVGILALYFILRLFDGVDSTWSRWRNWLWLRRKHKAYSKTNRGLIELIEANWKTSENYLMEGVDQSDAPLINFLAAAKAAHEQHAYDRRDVYLRRAYDLSPQTHVAVGLMQAQLQLDQNKYEQALATLNQVRHESPRQPLALKLLERIYVHLGDWSNLQKLIPALRKAKIISLDQMEKLENRTYQELLVNANKLNSLKSLEDLWNVMPRRVQKNPDVVFCYVTQLSSYPNTSVEIEELIVRTLKHSWHDGLVKMYGELVTPAPTKQLKIAESWQKTYSAHAILSLTLARLSMRCQLWGKARTYFEESLRLQPMAVTYLEYGKLLEQLNEEHLANKVYQDGLRLSI